MAPIHPRISGTRRTPSVATRGSGPGVAAGTATSAAAVDTAIARSLLLALVVATVIEDTSHSAD
jgi:hypothetical protein